MCLLAGLALRFAGAAISKWIDPILAVGALYLLSLGILELAERVFGGSAQTDFERGHVLVSSVWALIGLALLIAGLIRDERLLRFGGTALFGLSLAKIFLYDLSTLSSVARALSFIAVGALVLAGGFSLCRSSSRRATLKPRRAGRRPTLCLYSGRRPSARAGSPAGSASNDHSRRFQSGTGVSRSSSGTNRDDSARSSRWT